MANERQTFSQQWACCRIVEQMENGDLYFLSQNFKELAKKVGLEKKKDKRVLLLSVVGPHQSGKSFISNLLFGYLKSERKQLVMMSSGVKGFSFGNCKDLENCIFPSEKNPGCYLWPELVSVKEPRTGEEIFVWILHVHYPNTYFGEERSIETLNVLAHFASSSMIDIIWNQKVSNVDFQNHPFQYCHARLVV